MLISNSSPRQELVRRGAMDLDERNCNHRTLLQRLMVELVKEDEVAATLALQTKDLENQRRREALKLEREMKKQEAIQRSQLRRMEDPNYFANRNEVPSNGLVVVEYQISAEGEEESAITENHKCSSPSDVFRSYQETKRNKIYIK
jgi:hypothetical protein